MKRSVCAEIHDMLTKSVTVTSNNQFKIVWNKSLLVCTRSTLTSQLETILYDIWREKAWLSTLHRSQSYSVAHSKVVTWRYWSELRTFSIYTTVFSTLKTEISFMPTLYSLGMPWSILKMESQDMLHPNGLCGLFQDFLWPGAFGTFFTGIFLPFFRSSPWVMVRSVLGVVWAFSLIACRRGRCTWSVDFCSVLVRSYLLQVCSIENCNYGYTQESQTYCSMGLHGCLRTSYVNPLSRGPLQLWKFFKICVSFIKFIWLFK